MKVLDIMHDSIADGIGLRVVIFFAGCNHRCKGCHNAQSWNMEYGKDYSIDEIIKNIQTNKLISGVTLSGGDPMLQPKEVKELTKMLVGLGYDIWCYTGYTFDEIMNGSNKDRIELLKQCDVLVDGRFIESKKDLTLAFRGSSNQRIIDVQESLKQNKIVLYEELMK